MSEIQTVHGAIVKRLEEAAKHVGAIPTCVSMAAFCAGSLLFSPDVALGLAGCLFGVLGATEAFHIQTDAKLENRRNLSDPNILLGAFTRKYPNWHSKVIKEFNHNGFMFRSIGFNELPIPIGISNPLCPTCHEPICLEIAQCKYPGRVTIHFECLCGLSIASAKTLAELKVEAARLGGLPG